MCIVKDVFVLMVSQSMKVEGRRRGAIKSAGQLPKGSCLRKSAPFPVRHSSSIYRAGSDGGNCHPGRCPRLEASLRYARIKRWSCAVGTFETGITVRCWGVESVEAKGLI